MHKKCEQILKELESEGKIKVWWGYTFPEEIELTKKLKDVLEKDVDEKYYLSDKLIVGLIANTERQREKGNGFAFETTDGEGIAKTVTTRVGACRTGDNYIKSAYTRDFGSKGKVQETDDVCSTLQAAMGNGGGNVPIIKVVGELDIKGHDCIKRVYSGEGLAPTLTDMQGGNRQPKIIVDEPVIAASRGRNPDNPGDRTPGIPTEQRLEINKQGISNTITTVQKDNYVVEPVKAKTKIRIRKLSPRECWRLMGFGDEDFDKAAFTKETLYIEGGLIKCNAKLKVVKEKRRHIDMDTYVLCTTNSELEQDYQEQIMKKLCINKEMIEKTQNVSIAIELLEDVEPKECVTNIIKCGDYTETLCMLIKNLEQHHTAIIELEKQDSTSIGRYLKITSEENLNLMKSYIISILIKQIITSKIYGCINQKMNIQGCIAITTDYEKSLMMMKLSNLKMEFITRLNSDTALYKQARKLNLCACLRSGVQEFIWSGKRKEIVV